MASFYDETVNAGNEIGHFIQSRVTDSSVQYQIRPADGDRITSTVSAPLLTTERLAKLIPHEVKQIYFHHIVPRTQTLQRLLGFILQKVGWPKSIRYYKMVIGNDMDCHKDFMTQLGIRLSEVSSVDQSDVIIAFVSVTSRAGTDIDAALKQIPENRPLVFVVWHHTFEEDYITSDSSLSVSRSNALVVDGLFHEDKGMLKCPQNTMVLEKTAKYLRNMETNHRVAA